VLLTFSRRQTQNPRTVHFGQTVAAFHDVLASSARGKIDLRIDIPHPSATKPSPAPPI